MTTTGSAARRATRRQPCQNRRQPARYRLGPVAAAHGDRAGRLRLTIALTQLFLALTGYPQIGNSTFHIAHALWGGLFLLAAGIIALVVQNRGRRTGRCPTHRNRVRFVRRRGGQVHHPAQRLLFPAGRTDHLWLPGGDPVDHRARRTAPVASPRGPLAGGHRPQPDRGRRHRDPYRDAGHV